MRRREFLTLVGGAVAAMAADRAAAQAYPTRPITLVIPFPPGGGNDALGRLVAEKMSRSLGQQVVVDNRGGAGGTIATRAVAKSAPDGYTILLTYTGTLAINPTLYRSPGYDPRKDFAPIGLIGELSSVLVVVPSLPIRSVAELIAYAKQQPGKLDYAFVPGTVGHIITELFAHTAGIAVTRIFRPDADTLRKLVVTLRPANQLRKTGLGESRAGVRNGAHRHHAIAAFDQHIGHRLAQRAPLRNREQMLLAHRAGILDQRQIIETFGLCEDGASHVDFFVEGQTANGFRRRVRNGCQSGCQQCAR